MIPTILVYAILMMQQAGGSTGGGTVGPFVGAPPAIPFDVPPIEEDHATEMVYNCQADEEPQFCEHGLEHYKTFSCADTSRFMLMSEDGVRHCLALGQK